MKIKETTDFKTVEIDFSVLAALGMIVKCLFFLFLASFASYLTFQDLLFSGVNGISIFLFLLSAFVTLFYYFFPTILAANININLENIGAINLLLDYTIMPIAKLIMAIIFIPFGYLYVKIFHRNEGSPRYGWTFADVWESYFHDAKVDEIWEKTRIDVFGTGKRIQHPQLMWIFLLNIFLGITFIFYIIALVWAMNPKKVKVPLGDTHESTYFTDDFDKLDRIEKKNMKRLYPEDHEALYQEDYIGEEKAFNSNDNKNNEDSFKLRLKKIEKLYSEGMLTEEEYQEQRKRILSEI
jgi:hypothetical protein